MIVFDQNNKEGSELDHSMAAIFLSELSETTTNLEKSLIDLEKNKTNPDLINTAFRLFHNLKGSSAMMGFNALKDLCHYCESLLACARSNMIQPLQTEHIDLLLEALGAIRVISQDISHNQKEGSNRYFLLLHKLDCAALEWYTTTEGPNIEGEQTAQVQEAKNKKNAPKQTSLEEEIIKVNREHIDNLMLLVGEYITLKNRAQWLKRRFASDRQFLDLTLELENFAQKLQRNVLKLRLSSVGPVFNSMRRVVRTTAQQLGKKVDFELDGTDTLLDRSILDVLSEPLMHMIRNSLDHGVEKPEVRVDRNKPEVGRLFLKANYQGGDVHISLSDDGAGIDPARVRQKALDTGLITAQVASQMTKNEIIQLIFAPGFSSAEKVTETSGRGVGMDVVKSTIQNIGGDIDIQTELGIGTTITLRLPLSMSIIESLSFEVNGQAYAVPQANVEEVYSLHSTAIQEHINQLPGGGKCLMVREVPLPLLSLAHIFSEESSPGEALIQLRYGKKRFVLEVGRILGPTSILSQPLPPNYGANIPFSGITTRGDGSLLFQLDLEKVSRLVQNNGSSKRKSRSDNRGTAGTSQEGSLLTSSDIRRLQQKIITFHTYQHFCLPVQRAKRIVYLPQENIRCIGQGGEHYTTLDGETVKLLWVEKLILQEPIQNAPSYSLILFLHEGVTYGIPTAHFTGIKRLPESYESSMAQIGILGTTVIEDNTLLLLDLPSLVHLSRNPKGTVLAHPSPTAPVQRARHVLIAEDDKFFASELNATLRGQGIHTTLCKDGLEAKNALCQLDLVAQLDAVVTDIEMPNMTGLQLIRWIKTTPYLAKMPVIAYTAISTGEMRKKVLQLGAEDFISKMSFEPLLNCLNGIWNGKTKAPEAHDDGQSPGNSLRLVSIHVGNSIFALPMQHIKEVSPVGPSARIPNTPAYSDRLTFFRGRSIPVVKLRDFLQLEGHLGSHSQEQAVVEFNGNTFAILVDRVGEVLLESTLTPGEGFPMHTPREKAMAHLVRHVYKKGKETLILLDGDKLSENLFSDPHHTLEEPAA